MKNVHVLNGLYFFFNKSRIIFKVIMHGVLNTRIHGIIRLSTAAFQLTCRRLFHTKD